VKTVFKYRNKIGKIVVKADIGTYGNFTFSSFFLKPQNRFEPNLAEMFIGWTYTRFVFLVPSHGGHLEFPIGKRFTTLVQDHPMIIPAKSQFNWLSGF
jgi:hypothetical protein